jgi:flavodoxin
MKNIVLYDSIYGNTQQIATTIADNLPNSKLIYIDQINLNDLKNIDLLVVGSPTLGGRPTQKLQNFFNQIPQNALKDIKLAVFDTGFFESAQNFALRLLIKTIGYAAPKMASFLETKGAKLITSPETFIVTGKSGPLATGELDRAKLWAKEF